MKYIKKLIRNSKRALNQQVIKNKQEIVKYAPRLTGIQVLNQPETSRSCSLRVLILGNSYREVLSLASSIPNSLAQSSQLSSFSFISSVRIMDIKSEIMGSEALFFLQHTYVSFGFRCHPLRIGKTCRVLSSLRTELMDTSREIASPANSKETQVVVSA